MLEKLEARIKELEMALDKSAINHNILLGQLSEARNLKAILEDKSVDMNAEAASTVAHAD